MLASIISGELEEFYYKFEAIAGAFYEGCMMLDECTTIHGVDDQKKKTGLCICSTASEAAKKFIDDFDKLVGTVKEEEKKEQEGNENQRIRLIDGNALADAFRRSEALNAEYFANLAETAPEMTS